MDVGKPKKIHRVEPVEDPVPQEQPQEPPEEQPAEAPPQPLEASHRDEPALTVGYGTRYARR